jgi:hypothetical protein
MPNATSPTTFFDAWTDVSQHSSMFWWHAATALQPPDAAQPWQQWFTPWMDFWSQTSAAVPSPDVFQAAQKHWTEQLETLAQNLANVMGTEDFAAMQSKCLAQQLAWQDNLVKALHPHIDMVLRLYNLPSREQMERLFERLISLENRFDDVEAELRQLRSRVQEQSASAVMAATIPS